MGWTSPLYLTSGVLPGWKTFEAAFESHVTDHRGYRLNLTGRTDQATYYLALDTVVSSGSIAGCLLPDHGVGFAGVDELYALLVALCKLHDAGNDEAGSLASSILQHFNIEWV